MLTRVQPEVSGVVGVGHMDVEMGGQMKTLKNIVTVVLMAAVGCMGSSTLTWMMPVEVQLLGMAVTFGFLVREFWKDDGRVRYCEYRDRFVRER